MALFTTNAAGDLSVGATWVGGVAPGVNDTWLINHSVDWSTALAVGASAAAGAGDAITFGNSGKITFKAGWGATIKGDVLIGNATTFVERIVMDFQSGGTWEWNSSAAASPASQHYICKIGNNNFGYLKVKIRASAVAPVIFQSNAGGGQGYFDPNAQARTAYLDADYVNFTRIGNATNAMWKADLGDNTESTYIISGLSVIDACGETTSNLPGEHAHIDFTNVTWKNSAGTYTWRTAAGMNAPDVSATRRMRGCVHDKMCNLYGVKGMTMGGATAAEELVFDGGIECTAASNWSGTMRSFFLREGTSQTVATLPEGFAILDYYLLNDYGGIDPHFIADLTNSGTQSQSIGRGIWETRGTAGNAGNGFLVSSPGAARTTALNGVIVLQDDAGNGSANLVHGYGNTNHSVSALHCTVALRGDGGGIHAINDSTRFSAIKSNAFWKSSAAADNFKVTCVAGALTNADLVFGGGANVDFNGGWNMAAGSQLKGYDSLPGFTVAPGANDVNGDPQFVDSARRITKWSTSLGGAGTRADARTEMMKRNESGFNTAYSVRALIAYVEAGFAPQNAAYHAAHDGGWIGAVAGIAATGGNGGRFRVRIPRVSLGRAVVAIAAVLPAAVGRSRVLPFPQRRVGPPMRRAA